MSDLVERLRKLAIRQRNERGDYMTLGDADPEIFEAASELTRLTERVRVLEEKIEWMNATSISRNEVIEECAKIVDNYLTGAHADEAISRAIAAAIRSLKEPTND